MARKEVGYVELAWECPACHSRNPGPVRKCQQCGTPHPADVPFVLGPSTQLITDPEKIAAAKAAPDIHCAYCGTRNPSTAQYCKQCGALVAEGKARESGKVVGALPKPAEAKPVTCASCGTVNAAGATSCKQCGASLVPAAPPAEPEPEPATAGPNLGRLLPFILGGILLLIGAVIAFSVIGGRERTVVGEVQGVRWERVIAVEGLAPVVRQAWADQIPAGVQVLGCQKEVYKVTDQPVPGSQEVCGEPYVIDTGTGYGKVVQECEYRVYADRCSYRDMAWQPLPPIVLRGSDASPRWPEATVGNNQRLSGRSESYSVVFDVDGKEYRYAPRSAQEYEAFAPGSDWQLRVNSFGDVEVAGPR